MAGGYLAIYLEPGQDRHIDRSSGLESEHDHLEKFQHPYSVVRGWDNGGKCTHIALVYSSREADSRYLLSMDLDTRETLETWGKMHEFLLHRQPIELETFLRVPTRYPNIEKILE